MRSEGIVIIGGGQAGFQVAASLRKEGCEGRVMMVEAQEHLPYQRPPLSKTYIQGKLSVSGLLFRPQSFFSDHRIELVCDRADAIDRASRRVFLASGASMVYDHLVLCVGALARKLPLNDTRLDGVFELRNLADADALRPRLATARRVVVIGAGFVGLEFAAVARGAGAEVCVVDVASRAMARAVSQSMSDFVRRAHMNSGISFRMGTGITRLRRRNGAVLSVELADGTALPADIVLVGIGVEPDVRLAAEAGLAIDNGIKVDGYLSTSDPSISAIGDCVSFPYWRSGTRIRLESVQNACDQAATVAARLVGKAPAEYASLPWFWSDQGDLKLQIAGLGGGELDVQELPSANERAFCSLLFRNDQLVAVECVNRPGDFMAARKLLSRQSLALPRREAARPDFDLRAWEAASRPALAL